MGKARAVERKKPWEGTQPVNGGVADNFRVRARNTWTVRVLLHSGKPSTLPSSCRLSVLQCVCKLPPLWQRKGFATTLESAPEAQSLG